MRCKQCNKVFEAKRATAKYCSAKCRVNANRGLSVTDSVTPELSVTDEQPINVTLKGDKLDAEIPDFDTDLPDYVPFPIAQRYERPEESGYRAKSMETLAIGDLPEFNEDMPDTGKNQITYDIEQPVYGFNRKGQEESEEESEKEG